MNRFAALLDRLAYEPGRNNKLRLMTDYFRGTPDPERGFALAALTGALSFQHAKPSVHGATQSCELRKRNSGYFAKSLMLSYSVAPYLSHRIQPTWLHQNPRLGE